MRPGLTPEFKLTFSLNTSHTSSNTKRNQKLNRKIALTLLKSQLNTDSILPVKKNLQRHHKPLKKTKWSRRTIREGEKLGLGFTCFGRERKRHAAEKTVVRKPDPGIFCLCRGVDDGIRSMIQCDECKNWFHFECVRIKEDFVPTSYECPQCTEAKKKAKSPLDLLMLAIENDTKKEIFTEPRDSSTISFDNDKTLDVEGRFCLEEKKMRSLGYLFSKETNSFK